MKDRSRTREAGTRGRSRALPREPEASARRALISLACVLTVGLAPAASSGTEGWAARVGASNRPGQASVGMQFDPGEIVQGFHLVPQAEFAGGGGASTLGFHGDLLYEFPREQGNGFRLGGSAGILLRSDRSDLAAAAVLGYALPLSSAPVFFDFRAGVDRRSPEVMLVLGIDLPR